jgi:predicted permease
MVTLMMTAFVGDLRHAARNLRRAPGFAGITVLTLALGIGANSAIFSVVSAVILQPLAYGHPEQLVYISSQFPKQGFDQFWISPPEFLEFRERTRAFSSVGAFVTASTNLTAPERPLRVQTAFASRDLFTTLAVTPLAGRTFDQAEDLPNGPPAAVLSYDLWQSAFGGAAVLGTPVEINGVRRTIVGIMPPRFDVADQRVQLWLPLGLDPASRQNRGSHFLYLIGRLAPGSTLASSRGELETLLAGWPASVGAAAGAGPHSPDPINHRLRFDPLQVQIVGNARRAVWVLQGAVLLVLMIACANLANLLVARAESRRKEFAVRAALGAGRARLLAQFIVEGCVLSGTGAIIGLGLAVAGLRVLVTAFPDSLPRASGVSLNVSVLAFTAAVALLTGVVFGFTPLLHLGPDATASALAESGQRTTASAGRRRLRHGLVVGEVAVAVALVLAAGLLLRTVVNLTRVDAGFNRSHLVTFGISLPNAAYGRPEQVVGFYRQLLDGLRATPGVQSVAAMTGLPPLRQVNANDTMIEGYQPPPDGPFANVDYYQTTTAGYVETMGISVVEGRSFEAADANGPPVVLINQTMARTFYRAWSPVGQRVKPSGGGAIPWFTIVGVLKDVKQGGVDKKTGTELYFDADQLATVLPSFTAGTMNVALRTSLPPEALMGTIRGAVKALDPSLPIVKLRTMDDVFTEAIGRPRLLAELLGVFAALALILAAIGSYGALAYLVTERRREIGIRMALGADRASVLRMILSQGLRLTAAGVAGGLAVAFVVNRALVSLLFGVTPSDPTTVVGVVSLISIVALTACYAPAYSATRVDPMIVLRQE